MGDDIGEEDEEMTIEQEYQSYKNPGSAPPKKLKEDADGPGGVG